MSSPEKEKSPDELSLLKDVLKLQQKSTLYDQSISLNLVKLNKATEELKNLEKKTTVFFFTVIGLIVLFIGIKLLSVYLKNKTMITACSEAFASGKWPSGGFATALAFEYPALSGWMGFTDPYLPVAANIITTPNSGYNPSSQGQWNSSDSTCASYQISDLLDLTYKMSLQGTTSSAEESPIQLICSAYGNDCVQSCKDVNCKTLQTSDYLDIGMSAFGMGTNGSFLGHSAGGGIGAASAFSLFSIASGIISYMQKKSTINAQNEANGCNGTMVQN